MKRILKMTKNSKMIAGSDFNGSVNNLTPNKNEGTIDLRKDKDSVIEQKTIVEELVINSEPLKDSHTQVQFKIDIKTLSGSYSEMERAKLKMISLINDAIRGIDTTRPDGTKIQIKTQIITR